MRVAPVALAAALIAAGPVLAAPSDTFNYDPHKVATARVLNYDEGIMLSCIQGAAPNLMTLRSRSKIKAALMKMCVWSKGSDGFMTPEIAIPFGNQAIDNEIEYLLQTTQ